MIHRYRLRTAPDMSGKSRGMIGNIKSGEWVKYIDHKAVVEALKTKLLNAHDTGFNIGYSQAEEDFKGNN